MIIVLKPNTTPEAIDFVEELVKSHGLTTHVVHGHEMTIIGCIGDTSKIDAKLFEVNSFIDKVMHVQEPYKLANRTFHPDKSIVDVSGVKVGCGHLAMIAGPCSVESYEQVSEIAKAAKAAGANMLRGGAFKPRTSPYAFQGLGLEGLDILCAVKEEIGLPIVTELMSTDHLDIFNEKVDLIQVGARNMQNYDLLKQLVGFLLLQPIGSERRDVVRRQKVRFFLLSPVYRTLSSFSFSSRGSCLICHSRFKASE